MRLYAGLIILLLLITINASAQLNKIPRLWVDFRGTAADSAALSQMLFLLNTKDFAQIRSAARNTPQPTNIQCVNPLYPSIPKWFIQGSDTNFFKTPQGTYLTDFYTCANINPNNTFSYIQFETNNTGNTCDTQIISIDKANLNIRNVLHSYDIHIPGVNTLVIDGHDYQVDAHGNQLLPVLIDTVINTSCLPGGHANDTASIGWIVLLDSNNNLLWAWNPLSHGYSICEDRYIARSPNGKLDWSHCNSARFGINGNIQVSFRQVGVFEFNPISGSIVFKLGGLDTLNPVYIPIPDTANYYYQHDLMQIDSLHYSVYSDGKGTTHTLEGQTYYINTDSMLARLEERVKPLTTETSIVMGSFRKTTTAPFAPQPYSILNHGVTSQDYYGTGTYNQVADIENPAGNIIAELDGPVLQAPYRIEQTDWHIHNRPNLFINGNELADTTPNLSGYRWYLVADTALMLVDSTSGNHFMPTIPGIYCMEALYHTGSIIIHMVSDTINFSGPAGILLTQNQLEAIRVFPNPFTGQLNIQAAAHAYFNVLSMFGQTLFSGWLTQGMNSLNLSNLDNGIYFLNIPATGNTIKLLKTS